MFIGCNLCYQGVILLDKKNRQSLLRTNFFGSQICGQNDDIRLIIAKIDIRSKIMWFYLNLVIGYKDGRDYVYKIFYPSQILDEAGP